MVSEVKSIDFSYQHAFVSSMMFIFNLQYVNNTGMYGYVQKQKKTNMEFGVC